MYKNKLNTIIISLLIIMPSCNLYLNKSSLNKFDEKDFKTNSLVNVTNKLKINGYFYNCDARLSDGLKYFYIEPIVLYNDGTASCFINYTNYEKSNLRRQNMNFKEVTADSSIKEAMANFEEHIKSINPKDLYNDFGVSWGCYKIVGNHISIRRYEKPQGAKGAPIPIRLMSVFELKGLIENDSSFVIKQSGFLKSESNYTTNTKYLFKVLDNKPDSNNWTWKLWKEKQ